jgi:polyhydroxybutyrate depolymerase
VVVPASYTTGTATALVVLLHGYGFDGATQSAYFGIQTEAERRGFLLVHPDGTKNALGKSFWNATDACCGYDSTVDDVAYITAIIDDVSAKYTVDPKRVFVIGHSNGGFMSYRMACDRAGRIAAIASLAGATFADTSKCDPSEPVSVLQVHGTADNTIEYQGGEILGNRYPSAEQTVADWAAYNECSATATTGDATVDLLPAIEGAETTTKSYTGCPAGIGVELWSMDGAGHVPIPATTMVSAMLDFLFAHPKP